MANRYWVGGSGTWDNASTTHWSSSSGGSSGASAPSASDAVIIDASSGGGTITISATGGVCLSLTATGSTCTITGTLIPSGNVVLATGGTYNGLTLYVTPGGASVALTSSGKTLSEVQAYGTFTASDAINAALTVDSQSAVVLKSGATHTLSSISYPGSVGATIDSDSSGVQATISDSSGVNIVDYLSVKDIAFAGGATWYWGTAYTDRGNNTGITSSPSTSSASALFFGCPA